MLFVRSFKNDDLATLLALRKETILFINSADYSPDQIDAWVGSDDNDDNVRRLNIFNASYTLVAEEGDKIVGFANLFIDQHYLDQFYVSKDYQNRGVGQALLSAIEQKAIENSLDKISLESSITAKPFFEAHGYTVVLQQQKAITADIGLTNYIMEKNIKKSS